MKRILVLTVLAVLLLSTVGATTAMAQGPAKTALSCEPPTVAPTTGTAFDINGILTAGTDSKAVANKLITVYTSSDGKTWTQIGTDWTDATGLYTVTTTQYTTQTYYYKAVFAGDKLFQKVTSPTIPVTATVAGGSYTPIHAFCLKNGGMFVAKSACYWSTDGWVTTHESSHSKDITLEKSKTIELSDLGVPNGALVKMHAVVVGGNDRTGSEVFQYISGSTNFAGYLILGTTLDTTLMYEGLNRC